MSRLIDADRLLTDKMKSKYYHLPNGDTAIPIIDIEHAPTIEERKTGKWIYHDDDDMRYDTYHCSACRKTYTVDAGRFDDIGFVKEDLKFCPNCGAYMRGERHDMG